MIWLEGTPRTIFEPITKLNMPTLVGAEYFYLDAVRRVMLEPYKLNRASDLAAMFDRNRTRFEQYDPQPWVDRNDTADKIIKKATSTKEPGKHRFSLLNCSGIIIGFLNFEIIENEKTEAVYGYGLDGKHVGFGYATRALKLAVEFTTSHLRVKHHLAYIHDDNLSSQRIAERVGFKYFTHDTTQPQFRQYELYKQ